MIYKIICVIILFVVTFIPRALPIAFISKKIESRFIKDFLFYVPYAVLSALTFPSILYVVENIWIAIAGTVTAIILSLLNQKLIVVVIISVLVVFGLIIII